MFKKVQKATFTVMMWFAIALGVGVVGFLDYILVKLLINLWSEAYSLNLGLQLIWSLLFVLIAVVISYTAVDFALTMKTEIDDF